MTGAALAFAAGVLLLQQQATLPHALWLLLLPVCGLLAAWRRFLLVPAAFAVGLLWATAFAHLRLADRLAPELEGRDLEVAGVVARLPAATERGLRFAFDLESAVPGLARRVLLSLHKTSYGMHAAIDVFSSNSGDPEPVLAPLDAKIIGVFAKDAEPNSPSRIKAIYLKSEPIGTSSEPLFFRILHLSEIIVSAGEHVNAGQMIGLTGHTGFSQLAHEHLHFEIRLSPSLFGGTASDHIEDTVPINPYPYLIEWWDNSLSCS